jgi:hypothetical protein
MLDAQELLGPLRWLFTGSQLDVHAEFRCVLGVEAADHPPMSSQTGGRKPIPTDIGD